MNRTGPGSFGCESSWKSPRFTILIPSSWNTSTHGEIGKAGGAVEVDLLFHEPHRTRIVRMRIVVEVAQVYNINSQFMEYIHPRRDRKGGRRRRSRPSVP